MNLNFFSWPELQTTQSLTSLSILYRLKIIKYVHMYIQRLLFLVIANLFSISIDILQTVQRLMLSKGAKRTIFYHIIVILQYCWNKTIARSGDMYRDDLGILSLAIKCFGITNTSWQNFAVRISSVKTVSKCLRKLKVLRTNLINMYHL